MIRVLVNADDFGLDENRTRAILEAYHGGWISTTTAIVTMSWFEKAVELAKGSRLYQNIGLHLNLTEGQPLTDKIKQSRLFCREDGSFNASFHNSKLHRLWLPAFEQEAVAEEVWAQFEKFRQIGLPLRHLDSHHHTHTDWSIASIVLPLAKQAGVKTIRRSRNFGPGLTLSKRLYKLFINYKMDSCISLNTDYFCNFNDILSSEDLLPLDCFVEVMNHPVYSLNNKPDLDGTLTDFHDNFLPQKKFWQTPHKNIQLVDYSGTLA